MINPGNGSKWGIKPAQTNLTGDIHDIINNAVDFIILCGYNFSPYNHPSSVIPLLIRKRNAGVNVLVILPPKMWGFGNRNHTNNIQHLTNNNIGVILNSNNHSKWIISDYGYYYGSLNFTSISMKSRVEVVSICDALRQPNKPWWMNETKKELLGYVLTELNNFNNVTATTNLGAVNTAILTSLRNTFGQILRYNPEIEKVQKTLNNYEEVRMNLSSIIDLYYPLIEISELDKIWRLINNAIYTLDRLAYAGNDMLLKYENQSLRGFSIYGYNRIQANFTRQVEKIIDTIKQSDFQSIQQEKNIALTINLEKVLREYLRTNDDD
jgi:hypothetical protein